MYVIRGVLNMSIILIFRYKFCSWTFLPMLNGEIPPPSKNRGTFLAEGGNTRDMWAGDKKSGLPL